MRIALIADTFLPLRTSGAVQAARPGARVRAPGA